MVLSKESFIEEQAKNLVLFDFASKLKNSIIAKIEILADAVIICFYCDRYKDAFLRPGDKRIPQSEALNFGEYEDKELKMILNLIKDAKINDIGANCGWFSLELAARLEESKTYAFEPVLDLYFDLEKNINLNKFKNIETYNFGFSNENTKAKIYYDAANSAHTSLASTIDSHSEDKLTEINLKTLNSFTNEENKPDFIKIDVEGAELLVLQGASEVINKYQPILLEMVRKWTKCFNYHLNDLIHYLHEYDYSCYKILDENKLEAFPHMSEEDLESNFIFLHNVKHKNLIEQFSV